MSQPTEFPSSPRDPRFVAAVATVLAAGAGGVFFGAADGIRTGASLAFLVGTVLFALASAPVVARRFL
ncbi:hypothetical protein [Haloarchaeobius sp. TZWWS8]|uniref:hypothetical protein n=1 Tax=Haloarchaeobius sp. TZWWS8 TaxID=3446121 RepID=UPI003EBA115C